MKKHKKRGILCAIGAVLFAVAIPQMDSSEPAEIVMAVVIVLVLAFLAVRFLFPNIHLRKKARQAWQRPRPISAKIHISAACQWHRRGSRCQPHGT